MTISLVPNYIGTLSKQLFSLFLFSLLILPLLHAFSPSKCSSSNYYFESLRCGQFGVPIRFPLCDHPGFNLQCTNLNKTVIEFPMSGTFLVNYIDYAKQQISISDPGNCMVRRLLTFNISGTPFSYHNNVEYTFLTCPLHMEEPFRYLQIQHIPCLSNSTSSFLATSNLTLAESMLPSCKIVKRLSVPVVMTMFQYYGFSSFFEFEELLLDWNSPDCRACEKEYLRCGFRNKGSLEVKCFDEYKSGSGHLSSRSIIFITFCTIGGLTTCACIAMKMYHSETLVFQTTQDAPIASMTLTQQSRGVVVTRGLDQSTIDSYTKVELGESKRLPGTNDIICPICLSEYATKETVRCIPECEHSFHVDCIDAWLKIHNSCPICRNSRS